MQPCAVCWTHTTCNCRSSTNQLEKNSKGHCSREPQPTVHRPAQHNCSAYPAHDSCFLVLPKPAAQGGQASPRLAGSFLPQQQLCLFTGCVALSVSDLFLCHCCSHGVDLHTGLPPVDSRLDQVKVAPAAHTGRLHLHPLTSPTITMLHIICNSWTGLWSGPGPSQALQHNKLVSGVHCCICCDGVSEGGKWCFTIQFISKTQQAFTFGSAQ
jgi:hypothetical protein